MENWAVGFTLDYPLRKIGLVSLGYKRPIFPTEREALAFAEEYGIPKEYVRKFCEKISKMRYHRVYFNDGSELVFMSLEDALKFTKEYEIKEFVIKKIKKKGNKIDRISRFLWSLAISCAEDLYQN